MSHTHIQNPRNKTVSESLSFIITFGKEKKSFHGFQDNFPMDIDRFTNLCQQFVVEFRRIYGDGEHGFEEPHIEIDWDQSISAILLKFKQYRKYHSNCCIAEQQSAHQELDPSTVTTVLDATINWTVTVAIHSVYGVPTAYVDSMWNESGNVFDLNTCQEFLDDIRLNGNGIGHPLIHGDNHDARDNRQYEFGRLTVEIHPISDKPCYSFHICQLPAIMSMLNTTSVRLNEARGDNNLYLLNWFALMGPYFGCKFPPSVYSKLDAALS